VLGTSLLWRSTVAFTFLKVKSTKCLCLLPVVYYVLVLLFWSWSCKQRSWSQSWSCYFGLGLVSSDLDLGLGLVILVLVLVLRIWSCLCHWPLHFSAWKLEVDGPNLGPAKNMRRWHDEFDAFSRHSKTDLVNHTSINILSLRISESFQFS